MLVLAIGSSMGYWLVQHDIGAYWDRPDAIGSLKARALRDRNFRQIRKGDKIVYYAKQKRTLGLFQVSSEQWVELKSWSKTRKRVHMAYEVKPIVKAISEMDLRKRTPQRGRPHSLLARHLGTRRDKAGNRTDQHTLLMSGRRSTRLLGQLDCES